MSARTAQQILFVDDDANLRLVLSDFLKFEGFTVAVANSGEDALEKLSQLTPNLIILDMSMPGIGGLEFLKRISDASGKPRFPVLVLTARANMRDFFDDMHVDGFMSKPCEPHVLITEIERILLEAQSR